MFLIGLCLLIFGINADTENIDPDTALKTVDATITAYNTVHAQTDNTPCISASGKNICGLDNVVACPRSIKLGTWVIIDGIYYQCLDRMNRRFENRFDISFDKDIAGALEFGRQTKKVVIVDNSVNP